MKTKEISDIEYATNELNAYEKGRAEAIKEVLEILVTMRTYFCSYNRGAKELVSKKELKSKIKEIGK